MIRRRLPLAFALLLAVPVSALFAQETYEERHDTLYDSLASRKINTGQRDGPHRAGRTGFWTTQGRLQRGKETPATWKELVATLANADGAEDAGGANGGFSGWPGMDTYVRWQHRFPQNVKDAYFAEFSTLPTYGKGSTPNQRMMWAAACRLACETWGADTVTRFSDASNRTKEKTGRQYILNICDRTVRYNFEERWAKHYLIYTLGPLRSIADLSTDPVLANRARMTWNWGWLDIATFSFHGRWAIPAGRGGMTRDGNSSDISEYGSWLLFGGTPRASLLDADQCVNMTQPRTGQAHVVTPPPVLPEIFAAATRREKPFTRRGLARVHETQFATSYITRDWALYSQAEGDTTLHPDGTLNLTDLDNAGVPSNDWSSERWAVLWDESGPAGLTLKPPTGYRRAQGSGLGPHEDVVQHEGTLVGILNIPDTWQWKYTRDTIPTNTLAVINDSATTGRLYLHYSKVLVAITRSDIGNFTWPPAAQTPATKRGFAIECAALSEYPQPTPEARLAAFKADLSRHPPDFSQVSAPIPSMTYTNRAGRVLDITYGQGGRIDADPVDYESWPVQESPWSAQNQMGNLWVFGDTRTLLWNYQDWTEHSDHRPVAKANPPVAASSGRPVDIDLAARVTDADTPSTALVYQVGAPAGGSVTLLPDGHTARFTPAEGTTTAGAPGSFVFSAGGPFPDHRTVFHFNYNVLENSPDGLRIPDQSTNARHGILASAANSATATIATDAPAPLAARGLTTSLRFNAASPANISRQIHPATLNFSNHDWTFATWVKRASDTDDDIIFHVGTTGGSELQFFLPARSATLRVRHTTATGQRNIDFTLPPAAALPVGQWRHLAVQFERNGYHTGVVKLYLNGALAATSSPVTWSLPQTGPVFIAGPDADTAPASHFAGSLADTLLARGRLTPGEIARLASAPAAYLGGARLVQTVTLNAAGSGAQTRTGNPVQLDSATADNSSTP